MLVGATPRRVAIVGGVRIPFARGNGAYAEVGNQEMLTATLRAVVEQYGLQGQRLDDVAAGAVMKHSDQWNLTRESVLGCGLAEIVVPILTTSVRAAKLFADESVPFCFIDADHSYASVTADLHAWWPKVRAGGMIAGHDYRQTAS